VIGEDVGAALGEVNLISAVHDEQVVGAAPRLFEAKHGFLLVFGLALGDAVDFEVDGEVDDVVRWIRRVLGFVGAENQVHPVEASAHDALLGVAKVKSVTQLVQNRPQGGRVAAAISASEMRI